jgi:hypothetical protein
MMADAGKTVIVAALNGTFQRKVHKFIINNLGLIKLLLAFWICARLNTIG